MKKDYSIEDYKDYIASAYSANGYGLYPPPPAGVVNDPYIRMHWAVLEFAAREASAFRPWNQVGSCKHR